MSVQATTQAIGAGRRKYHVVVAIPGFKLNHLNPKEFAVFSFVSSRATTLERPQTPLAAPITYTR
jgi:hypothetical protein